MDEGSERRAVATLRFLYCGQGDTILVESDGHWGLVDCHLTKESRAYHRLRRYVDDLGIESLDFVLLTHSDRDHFFGMQEFLEEKFYEPDTEKASFDEFWDAGIAYSLLLALDTRLSGGNPVFAKGIKELYGQFVLPLSDRNLIERRTAQQKLADVFGQFWVNVLSPRTNDVERFNAHSTGKILMKSIEWCQGLRQSRNDLSVVIALSHKDVPVSFLLTGDATQATWPIALARWKELVGESEGRRADHFAGVKVSHHGALSGHEPSLYRDYCRPGESLAVLTVGDDYEKHPHPDVLADLARCGMKVYATCCPEGAIEDVKTEGPPPPGEPVEGVGTYPVLDGYRCQDVTVTIWSDGQATAEPPEALLPLPPA